MFWLRRQSNGKQLVKVVIVFIKVVILVILFVDLYGSRGDRPARRRGRSLPLRTSRALSLHQPRDSVLGAPVDGFAVEQGGVEEGTRWSRRQGKRGGMEVVAPSRALGLSTRSRLEDCLHDLHVPSTDREFFFSCGDSLLPSACVRAWFSSHLISSHSSLGR